MLDSIYLSQDKYIQDIFSRVWSLVFTYAPLMVSLSMIALDIVILLGVLSILVSLVPIFLILSTS